MMNNKKRVKMYIHRVDMYKVEDVNLSYEETRELCGYEVLYTRNHYYWDSKNNKVRYEGKKDVFFAYAIDNENRALCMDTINEKFGQSIDERLTVYFNLDDLELRLKDMFDKAFDENFNNQRIKDYKERQEKSDREREERNMQYAEEQAKKEKERKNELSKKAADLIAGDKIRLEPEELIDILKEFDLKLPLRTHGSLVANVYWIEFNKGNVVSLSRGKGKTVSTKAINEVVQKMIKSMEV